ncbi:tetratricopeptide repeat protein [Ekhidna sp. To15]|uniref:tetratricopeptide repeat protein n=1 Tax=Ekhidna sp. To15 TaxID=3395267 RepID=UPI003F525B49
MTKLLLLFFFVFNIFSAQSSSIQKEDVDKIYAIHKIDPDSAYQLSYGLVLECNTNEDYYGLVKLNYLLGYLHKKDKNIGKSVLHYLEAIRFSEDAEYDGLSTDAIVLRYNLGNLYRTYKANDLAITYYLEAIEIADWIDDKEMLVKLKFNLALTYEQAKQSEKAISLFNELLNSSSEEREKRILNQLGLIYWEQGDLENAKLYFKKLLDVEEKFKIYSAKALHNLGEIEFEVGNKENAIELINESIQLKKEISEVDGRSLFISYKVLGDYLFERKDFKGALNVYTKAETLIDEVKHESMSFELYRSLSQLNYEMNNSEEARIYSNLHSSTVDSYLISQQSLQETDRQFNMDLITKRYLEEVAKQEQIASILLYSKVISGSLLALLLFTIGLNWYQKVQLRKSIVRDLINLKVVD